MTNRLGGRLSLLLAGALAGGVAATLAAPCSGKRMRKLARRRLSEVKKGLRQRRDELLSRSEQIVRGAQKLFA